MAYPVQAERHLSLHTWQTVRTVANRAVLFGQIVLTIYKTWRAMVRYETSLTCMQLHIHKFERHGLRVVSFSETNEASARYCQAFHAKFNAQFKMKLLGIAYRDVDHS